MTGTISIYSWSPLRPRTDQKGVNPWDIRDHSDSVKATSPITVKHVINCPSICHVDFDGKLARHAGLLYTSKFSVHTSQIPHISESIAYFNNIRGIGFRLKTALFNTLHKILWRSSRFDDAGLRTFWLTGCKNNVFRIPFTVFQQNFIQHRAETACHNFFFFCHIECVTSRHRDGAAVEGKKYPGNMRAEVRTVCGEALNNISAGSQTDLNYADFSSAFHRWKRPPWPNQVEMLKRYFADELTCCRMKRMFLLPWWF